MTRRKFLTLGALALPSAAGVDARFIEPTDLQVRELTLNENGGCRFVQFTDFHYAGNVEYASELVGTINGLAPEFVCFTGDLVDNKRYAAEALSFIAQIKAPVYGSPGNHDYSTGVAFSDYQKVFSATGGAWLADASATVLGHDLEIVGMGVRGFQMLKPPQAARRLLLLHFPELSDQLPPHKFDLILAGHSHGGQVRLPLVGAIYLPWGVGRYDLGYFESAGGPLYVNPGVGTYPYPIRFNCPPEVTLITI
ncbi:MAG: metallophosphoesterase [Chthoniobacterales bacterium]|nr:metallophosphoesterase [Chthoniobacterales bacterium]